MALCLNGPDCHPQWSCVYVAPYLSGSGPQCSWVSLVLSLSDLRGLSLGSSMVLVLSVTESLFMGRSGPRYCCLWASVVSSVVMSVSLDLSGFGLQLSWF